jgi:hypothetical protein
MRLKARYRIIKRYSGGFKKNVVLSKSEISKLILGYPITHQSEIFLNVLPMNFERTSNEKWHFLNVLPMKNGGGIRVT